MTQIGVDHGRHRLTGRLRHIGGYRMSRDHAAITVRDDGPA
jgi:hypothetical protein